MPLAEESADSEGEEWGLIRPNFIKELRNVLDEYPDDGQILKEMIQNAEDAGAKTVQITADKREFHRQLDKATVKKHPHLMYLKGPALCVYNDEYFTDKDWEGIRMLHASVKEEDPIKVGRSGLGFKSVFHLTDRLVILSGDRILYMDPYKGEDRYCNSKKCSGIKGRELQSIIFALEGICTITKEEFQTSGFPGTLFWFPLRDEPSELSETLYTESNLEDLFIGFKAEARSMMLFLKNIENISLYYRNKEEAKKEVFSVSVHSSSLQRIRAVRKDFINRLPKKYGTLPHKSISSRTDLLIETVDHLNSISDRQQWLVVNFYPSKRDVSSELSKICMDSHLALTPMVGVALPIDAHGDFQGQIFCFLPLPSGTESSTGLPVHVNGFFALSQNRRHIKWPTADQMHHNTHLETAIKWNCLLVKEILPMAYEQLLTRLKEQYPKNPEVVYSAWPDLDKVDEVWKPLLVAVYKYIIMRNFFYTPARGGSWIKLNEAVLFCELCTHQDVNLADAIIEVYNLSNENIVILPKHVKLSLPEQELEKVRKSTPHHVSSVVRKCLTKLNTEYKVFVLQYLLSDPNSAKLISGLQLLPLQDETFGTFTNRRPYIYWCGEEVLKLFPGLESRFCSCTVATVRDQLKGIAQKGVFSLRLLPTSSEDIPQLISSSLQKRFGNSSPLLPSEDIWIQNIWTFLSETVPWKEDLNSFSDMTLLPDTVGDQLSLLPLSGLYVCSAVDGVGSLAPALMSCLSKLEIKVLSSLPQYVARHKQVLGKLVQYPCTEGILTALMNVNGTASRRMAALTKFNATSTSEEKEALLSLVAEDGIRIDEVKDLLLSLNLFKENWNDKYVSINTLKVVRPQNLPPVYAPLHFLVCSPLALRAAIKLGALQMPLEKLVEETLQCMLLENSCFSSIDVAVFMTYFLYNKLFLNNKALVTLAKNVKFVPMTSGVVKSARDLYDPSCPILAEIFLAEERFPSEGFVAPKLLESMKKIGLRTKVSLKQDDLIESALMIENLWNKGEHTIATKKAHGLWKLLKDHGDTIEAATLSRISEIQCLPCLQQYELPAEYPCEMPLKSQPSLVKPAEMCGYSFLRVVGSVAPIMPSCLPDVVCKGLKIGSHMTISKVFQHLQEVVNHFNVRHVSQFHRILHDIFLFLHEHRAKAEVIDTLQGKCCILIESEGTFAQPNKFWVKRSKDDMDLRPFRFPLSLEMSTFQDLFLDCGSYSNQNITLLQDVLKDIQAHHTCSAVSGEEFLVDLRIVKQILELLKRSTIAETGMVIIPVWNGESNRLHFQAAKDCTVGKGSWQHLGNSNSTNEEKIIFVHPEIPEDTAIALGALDMRDRALTGIEELDFGYGQHEELTDRLHSLLKDSYTDGFSIPKELIQNADDAGSTEVRFLLDERENNDAKTNLITDRMASLQGPALWVFNNKTFSDDDFANIVKLGGATKKSDTSKIGKFGLGFNSVYNLTDTPSFISRHIFAMFDPHVKYLKGSGMKLDFQKSINRELLWKMPEIFKPFQGIFGCRLQHNVDVYYDGTLFRFPLRTPEQAEESKLKNVSYSDEKRKEFLKMLLDRAGSLLLFSQNVTKLQVFHIPKNCNDPVNAHCLLTVNKRSQQEVLLPNKSLGGRSILKFFVDEWMAYNIQIKEDIDIEILTTIHSSTFCGVRDDASTTRWRVVWASGTDLSAVKAKNCRSDNLIPLAATAISMKDHCILPLSQLARGFYKTGHLFCFFPLPEEMVQLALRVHVNGTFALNSSRRGLLVKTEDDLHFLESDWNSALFSDAVCCSYLLLLESMQNAEHLQNNFLKLYFDLWPRASDQSSLAPMFYRRLITDKNKVFPTSRNGEWVSFHDAWFLEPAFRDSKYGEIAWNTLQTFWKRDGILVDVPTYICHSFQNAGQSEVFDGKVLTHEYFYKEVFFPNIQNKLMKKEHRNKLVLYALTLDKPMIHGLIRTHACIPCSNREILCLPSNLVHPDKKAAKLYLVSDGYFPHDSRTMDTQNECDVNFCSRSSLKRLCQLGMITDDLPEKMLVERVQSVRVLHGKNSRLAMIRICNLMEYLSSPCENGYRFTTLSPGTKEHLSKTRFLPIQPKPVEWPFPWGGDDEGQLEAPVNLFSENLKPLVSCKAKLLDHKSVNGAKEFNSVNNKVVKWLGLKTKAKPYDQDLIKLAISQLEIISKNHQESGADITSKMCSELYSYLNKCCMDSNTTWAKNIISEKLARMSSVWISNTFVFPTRVAFHNKHDCRPYLYQLDSAFQYYQPLCEAMGVKKEFSKDDALGVFDEIRQQFGEYSLPEEIIELVSRAANLLCDAIKRVRGSNLLDGRNIFLPDRSGFFQPINNLCLDDCTWLQESDMMKFVHDLISPATAKALGVQSKKERDYDMLGDVMPFGQSECLTTRIKKLLQGYRCDSSLFKELVQNADDAGATEIKFIKDFRTLPTNRVPFGWEQLQGASLCVYNNKSFSAEDMRRIQRLGDSSKGQELLKIGTYGVGFNAVYHLTDVPSFWTREDDEKEVICVFDPNCKYVKKAIPQHPGIKFTNIERLKKEYPDMFSGYLSDGIEMMKPGTLFRLPLRTRQMAKYSKIANDEVTKEKLKILLNQFKEEMSCCLLFLNHIRKIGIYTVDDNGALVSECEVVLSMDEKCTDNLNNFTDKLQEVSIAITERKVLLEAIKNLESVQSVTIGDSVGHEERWIVVNRVGFTDSTSLPSSLCTYWNEGNYQLLPQGGVAVQLDWNNEEKSTSLKLKKHAVFCTLPLPVETKLPVHINGHFILDNETRRTLLNEKGDHRTVWNEVIADEVIVQAYISAITEAKNRWFGTPEPVPVKQVVVSKLGLYNRLFPDIQQAPSTFWKKMIKKLYMEIAHKELPIFPVACSESNTLEWVPVVSKCGFPGYFHDLATFFKSLKHKTKNSKSESLPGISGSELNTHLLNSNWPKKKAKQIKLLLKNLNMKILKAPSCIFHSFKSSGTECVHEVTPANVIQFLKSFGSQTLNGCSLNGLPLAVSQTPFKTAANVKQLIRFVRHEPSFLESLEGLPLCLRQSGNLWAFKECESQLPIVSEFCYLFPESADEFMHQEIYKHFQCRSINTNKYLKELDIQSLTSMLPGTLPVMKYKSGQSCIFQPETFPCTDWIEKLWSFLQTQLLSKNEANEHVICMNIEKQLSCLSEWSLIPARKRYKDIEQALLVPVKDMKSVVFLSQFRDQSNPQLWDILKMLPLAFLETQYLPKDCALTKVVASLSHPTALLHALASLGQNLQLSSKQAIEILLHFNRSIVVLKESFANKSELQIILKRLPFFTFIDGELACIPSVMRIICLPKCIPHGGLRVWSQSRQKPIALLLQEAVPENIRNFLSFESPTVAEFYCSYLLPTLERLENDSVEIHMAFIRDYIHSFSKDDVRALTIQLQDTPFIKMQDQRYRARDFFSDAQPVFTAMRPHECSLPKPYCEDEWRHFMQTAGIIHEISEDLFVIFAKELESAGSSEVTPAIATKSDALVLCLFEMKNLLVSGILPKVKDVRFLRPSEWRSEDKGKHMCNIAQPFTNERLVSFSESCQERHLYLVWSSSCILHPNADPITHKFWPQDKTKILEQLGFSETVPNKKVISHIKNISHSSSGESCDAGFKHLDQNRDLVKNIWTEIYKYLNKNFSAADFELLKDMCIILDTDKKQLLKADSVVLDLREDEAIEGHIQKAPSVFGAFFTLFEKLGVAHRVTANHYANVLLHLKTQAGRNQLHVEEMKVVKRAVEGLFRCLKSSADVERTLDVKDLFLPGEDRCLWASHKLIIVDDLLLKERSPEPPSGMKFFLGFKGLKINIPQPLDEVKHLPEKHQMKCLSHVVREIIPERIKITATNVESSHPLASKLNCDYCIKILLQQIRHDCRRRGEELTKETEQKIKQQLQSISIKKIDNLQTILTDTNTESKKSSRKKMSFIEKSDTSLRKCIIYVDTNACIDMENMDDPLMDSLTDAVEFILGNIKINKFILYNIFKDPSIVESFMLRHGIYEGTKQTAFPPPGSFIPNAIHCYLDNNFCTFYEGEHAGFEVYDPRLDAGDSFKDDPVFLYAKVLNEIKEDDKSEPFQKYSIDLGPERGRHTVSVTKLYKFIRKPERMVPNVIEETAQHCENEGETLQPKDLKAVLMEIQQTMKEAWNFKDRKDRMRVVKRLYLKWHPDKNNGNEDFCKQVVQAIHNYVHNLDKGIPLTDEDNEYVAASQSDVLNRQSSSTSLSFFEDINSRELRYQASYRRQNQNYSENDRNADIDGACSQNTSFFSELNPQPLEGQRFFQQAKEDHFAAKEAKQKCAKGHNWVCFQCHQAVEKALKAVLYHRGSGQNVLFTHDLDDLAKLVDEQEHSQLGALLKKMKEIVGSYSSMRYPGVVHYPKIPAEVYTADQAKQAWKLTDQILVKVKELLT